MTQLKRKSNVKTNFKDPKISGFLGIGEGKIAAAKAAGEVKKTEAEANARMMDALIAEATNFNSAQAAAANAAAATAADASKSKYTVYIAIGVVFILMVGLFFIVKARRRA